MNVSFNTIFPALAAKLILTFGLSLPAGLAVGDLDSAGACCWHVMVFRFMRGENLPKHNEDLRKYGEQMKQLKGKACL